MSEKSNVNVPYQLFALVLCVLVLGLLLFDTTQSINEETRILLKWVDYGLCILFFADFIYQLLTVENRRKYLVTWGWIDLISCVPTFSWGRIARLLRILKLLKAIRSSKTLFEAINRRRGESALLTAVLLLICGTVFGSVAIMECEHDEINANITNASDAIWWTFCTILKGGCENYDPVSIEGRCVAIVLMFLGVAINGTIIGFVAVLLSSNKNDPQDESTEK